MVNNFNLGHHNRSYCLSVLYFNWGSFPLTCLSHHPRQPEEEHDSPDVEQAPHVDSLEPPELDDALAFAVAVVFLDILVPVGLVPLVPLDGLLVQELLQGGAGTVRVT